MTKCIKRIRDLFEYALYKFSNLHFTYLLTYLLTSFCTILQLLATEKAEGPRRPMFRPKTKGPK